MQSIFSMAYDAHSCMKYPNLIEWNDVQWTNLSFIGSNKINEFDAQLQHRASLDILGSKEDREKCAIGQRINNFCSAAVRFVNFECMDCAAATTPHHHNIGAHSIKNIEKTSFTNNFASLWCVSIIICFAFKPNLNNEMLSNAKTTTYADAHAYYRIVYDLFGHIFFRVCVQCSSLILCCSSPFAITYAN